MSTVRDHLPVGLPRARKFCETRKAQRSQEFGRSSQRRFLVTTGRCRSAFVIRSTGCAETSAQMRLEGRHVHSRFRVGLLVPSRVSLSGCVLLSWCVSLSGLLFGGEAATAATAGCRGRTCNGKSPVAMRCATDAVTINSVVDEDRASGGTFGRQVNSIRYSRRCNASWARVTATAGGTAIATRSTAYMGGYKPSTQRTRNGPGSTYSNMRSGSSINACARTTFGSNAVVKKNCASTG
jgi:hypothetical protein